MSISTDGAASQFKQKFTLSNVTHYLSEKGITVQWNFFATSHGKGAVDGIGGQVKRKAWLAALSGKSVHSVKEFISVVLDSDKIKLVEILKSDVQNVQCVLDERWEDLKPIPETPKMHSMIAVRVNVVQYARFGSSDEWCEHEFKHLDGVPKIAGCISLNEGPEKSECIQVAVNDWVVVVYDDVSYPGEVTAIKDQFVEVNTMSTSNRKTWHWPERPDILLYNKNQIRAKIDQPIPTGGSRGLYKFDSPFL